MIYNPHQLLPDDIWTTKQIGVLQSEIVKKMHISLLELMHRAGQASFDCIINLWPNSRHWLILCGNSSNGQKGYIIAELARNAGITVTVMGCYGPFFHKSCNKYQKYQDAQLKWIEKGESIYSAHTPFPDKVDIIIDALLGIEMNNIPIFPYNILISRANQHSAPIFSIDIPSGLLADTGFTPGEVIHAAHTITFIGIKPGLITGQARKYVGKLHYHSLDTNVVLNKHHSSISRWDKTCLTEKFLPLKIPTSHKGQHGKLLLIGGDIGTAGAIILTGKAALRSGTGLVKIITHKLNIIPVLSNCPELMVQKYSRNTLEKYIKWANTIIIGPGIGQQSWGKKIMFRIKQSHQPSLWDADALTFLANNRNIRMNRIITPHSGEAAKLLKMHISEVEKDRLQAAKLLAKYYGGVVVLKGSGTVIASHSGEVAIADVGNVGLATGGMGDILSGIIGSFLGQQFSIYKAAILGCIVHGVAADILSASGTRGMVASDLLPIIFKLVNCNRSS
ncbi:MAG: NAD(P)H-hydrate dehydratase [Candidatus Dasytiphilus stammeri]